MEPLIGKEPFSGRGYYIQKSYLNCQDQVISRLLTQLSTRQLDPEPKTVDRN